MANTNNQTSDKAKIIINDVNSPMTVKVEFKKIPLFLGLDETTIRKIAESIKLHHVEYGHTIIEKGSAGENLIILLSGRLQVVDPTEKVSFPNTTFMSAGDYFGEVSIIDGLPHFASVSACEKSTYALLPRTDALHLMYNNPLVSERIFKKLAVGVRQASNIRIILRIPNAFQRV